MSKTASQIRNDFVEFFEQRGHTHIPSSPVVPQDDPTLLFTNAGMNQFKAIFLGENQARLKRAANSQKCMRVSGKHNDLEEVGRDHHHHTFFEMLGNWSFGDYYKKEAITWAWELLTGVWQLPKERLFVTVHSSDDEAAQLWQTQTDIDPSRIIKFGDKENFWEMGETGPCGPCSEIHYDMGELSTQAQTFADKVHGVNGANDRYREIWNLVFMQYNRGRDGTLTDLPAKNVDTGMGFERICTIIQGVKSNYETDILRAIIAHTEKLAGRAYFADERGMAFRVIADHIRALVFAITDGAFPSNEGRGYVLRRLLRRAYRFGRELGFTEPFLYQLVPTVAKTMGEAFPEITQRIDYCQEVIRAEEDRFGQTLEQGIDRFDTMVARVRATGSDLIAGEDVFQLYDTYGFPMDLTRLMAQEQGLRIDEAGFESSMSAQRTRAREASRKGDANGLSADGWIDLAPASGTEFTGYDNDTGLAQVYRYKSLTDTSVLLVLDKTTFYAESGGQTGDRGTLTTASGKTIEITDTIKWNDTVVHQGCATEPLVRADFERPVTLAIDGSRRTATRRNHSATHLLQAALRTVLGAHVQQSGSRVDHEALRFDFTHFQGVSTAELERVEDLVNGWILDNNEVSTEVKAVAQAKAEGATALFGEKYGDTVRVVAMGAVSKELCGGTHVRATGQIGLFHITGESSISAGVRRIEAITGLGCVRLLRQKECALGQLTALLKVPESRLAERIESLGNALRESEEKLAQLSARSALLQIGDFFDSAVSTGSFPWLVKNLGSVDKDSFARIADTLSDELKRRDGATHLFVLGAQVDGKALFAACTTQGTVSAHKVHCGEIVKLAAGIAGGGGGGSPVRAQAGGRDGSKLADALAAVTRLLEQKGV